MIPVEAAGLTNVAILDSWFYERRDLNDGPVIFRAYFLPSHLERKLHYEKLCNVFGLLRNPERLVLRSTDSTKREIKISDKAKISEFVATIVENSYWQPFKNDDLEKTSEVKAIGKSFGSLELVLLDQGHVVLVNYEEDVFAFSLSPAGRDLLRPYFENRDSHSGSANKRARYYDVGHSGSGLRGQANRVSQAFTGTGAVTELLAFPRNSSR